jgi:hypothetical protein
LYFAVKSTYCLKLNVLGKVTDTGCTKDGTDQCKHTPNAECDNAETGAKCKCSDGYAEDRTNGKTCMQSKFMCISELVLFIILYYTTHLETFF